MFDFYWISATDPSKQGAGRLGNVTKLLQRQRRDSQCNGICMVLSTRKPSVPFPRSPQGWRYGGITSGKFSNLLRRNCRRKITAPPPSEKLLRVD